MTAFYLSSCVERPTRPYNAIAQALTADYYNTPETSYNATQHHYKPHRIGRTDRTIERREKPNKRHTEPPKHKHTQTDGERRRESQSATRNDDRKPEQIRPQREKDAHSITPYGWPPLPELRSRRPTTGDEKQIRPTTENRNRETDPAAFIFVSNMTKHFYLL